VCSWLFAYQLGTVAFWSLAQRPECVRGPNVNNHDVLHLLFGKLVLPIAVTLINQIDHVNKGKPFKY
jgi:hypothetical protein